MSIRTRRGDRGETDLLYSRRIAKTDLRIHAIGAIDELTSALGLARIVASAAAKEDIAAIQQDLVSLMGELACAPGDELRYSRDGHNLLGQSDIDRLDQGIDALESVLPKVTDWVIPGARGSEAGARFDHARSVCRRAEREILDLAEAEPEFRPDLPIYLNRLADLLWLHARAAETTQNP